MRREQGGAATPTTPKLRPFLRVTPLIAGSFAIMVGAVVLAGWWLAAPMMPSLVPGGISMVPNSAVMCILAGMALVLRARIARRPRALARLCAIAVCAIAGFTLVEYGSGIQFPINRLLAPGAIMRPSPQAAIAFMLFGTAMLLLEREATRRACEYLAVASGAIAILALLGYLFGAEALYDLARLRPYVGMGIHTAAVVLLLNLGILAACADRGFLAVVSASDAGGIAARRLLVGLAVLPPIAIAIVLGARAGWYAPELASALVLFVALVEATGFTLRTAVHLSRLDAEARRTAVALRDSELYVRALVEQAADGIFVADLDGRYTDVNEAGCRMLGYTRDQLIGKTVVDLLEPEDVPRLAAAKAQLLAGGIQVAEWKLRRSDGTLLPVEISAKIFPDGRWQGIVRDITDRVRAEALIRRERTWLQSTLDQLPEGVILLDARGEVRAMNRAVVALESGDTGGQDPWGNPVRFDVRDLDGRELAFDELPVVRALRTGEVTRDRELVLRRRDGTTVPIMANAVPVRDDTGEITGAMVLVRDITEQKEFDQLREEWAAVVAHDLRQPVSTVSLAIDLLDAMHGDQRSEKERTVLERIRSASRRLDRMIDDLLDTSRVASSRLAVECDEIDLTSVVRTAVEGLRPASGGSELRVVAEPHLRAWADADRIHQVLGNLVSNALKYGEPGGEIVVEVVQREREREREREVIVTNTGPEISQDELPHLFDRFVRTREARASKQPGLGLGLYISKGLIEAHGGRMWAESSRGHTSFHFTVPAAPANAPRARSVDAPTTQRPF